MSLTASEYDRHDAMGLAALVRTKQVTPAELLETFVERAAALNPRLNAVVEPAYDLARAAVEKGLPDGPFTGVPYLVKNLHAAAEGTVLTFGSRLYAGNRCSFDTETVARLRRAGFVVAGRTNSPEFGMADTTEPVAYGPTHNPWNLAHSPGGSSGGAAAAVAGGILPAAHATDSGGSIRIPAGWCGLVGLKPTRGRNPTGPNRGNPAQGVSHEHAVTRSVRDCAAILDATSGPDEGAPFYAPPPPRPFLEEIGADPGKLRIAFATASFQGRPSDPDCVAAVENAARLLESLGHKVAPAALAFDLDRLLEAMATFLLSGFKAQMNALEAQRGRPLDASEVEPVSWQGYLKSQHYTGADYAVAEMAMNAEVRRIAAFFRDWDVLMTPTAAMPPPRLGLIPADLDDPEAFMRDLYIRSPFTAPFNATGQPAVSLPLHWTKEGLPVGVQLVARYAEDALLLRLAAQLEEAAPWFDRRPAIAAAAAPSAVAAG